MTKEVDRTGHRITIRVTDEFHEQIKRLAKRDRRSVAGWIKIALEDTVAAAEPAPAPAPHPKKR